MSAFREHVPQAYDLQRAEAERGGPDPLTEMRAYAGLVELGGALPATGPVGPRALLPAPRAPWSPSQLPLRPSPRPDGRPASAVANDPTSGERYALGARRARRAYTEQWRMEDNRAVLQDPRVSSTLRQVYRLVADIDHTLQQKQGTLEALRLHISHLLDTAARQPEAATQLRGHIPNLLALLQDLAAGNPSEEYRRRVATAMAELDAAGASVPEGSSVTGPAASTTRIEFDFPSLGF